MSIAILYNILPLQMEMEDRCLHSFILILLQLMSVNKKTVMQMTGCNRNDSSSVDGGTSTSTLAMLRFLQSLSLLLVDSLHCMFRESGLVGSILYMAEWGECKT